ncbi:MAG: molybdopterin-dependent oxidoreductase, partial [bacterium]
MTTTKETRTHYRTCNLCEAMCGIQIKVQGDEILSIRGDNDDPFSRGHICPKAVALQDVYYDKDRLIHPVRRTKDGWERISWVEAFIEVVNNIHAIQEKYGKNAVGVYLGNPVVHNIGSMLFLPRFSKSLDTRSRFSATSVDQLPHHFAAHFMFGHPLLIPIPDIDRTDFFLMLGANPAASNGSLMTAPGIVNRLKALRKRGGKLIVVDPRFTETAAIADEHFFIKPGTDVLFLLALLHTVYQEHLEKQARLMGFTDGLDEIREIVSHFSPESVTGNTGVPAENIRQLASDFCKAESAVCYGRLGVSTQAFGAAAQWLINVLNIITGNFDRRGGAMFTLPAIDVVRMGRGKRKKKRLGRWRSRVRQLPEFNGELPASVLAEEMLTEGDGQIKALFTVAGNPVLSTPNGAQLEKALTTLEFMVAIDIYINETTRHARIILPPACGLETDHYDIAFHILGVRNTAKYSPALFEPAKGAKYDWEIFKELEKRLSVNSNPGDIFSRLKKTLAHADTPQKLLDRGLRFGPYGLFGGKNLWGGLHLKKLKKLPHGIDLGPLKPCLPERLLTESGRIQLAPEVLINDVKRVRKAFLDPPQLKESGFDLSLIGRRQLRSNNSWMHNSLRLVKGKNRCRLMIHPDDAAVRNIENNQIVRVSSRVGSVNIPV